MKITKQNLIKIIKEEVGNLMEREADKNSGLAGLSPEARKMFNAAKKKDPKMHLSYNHFVDTAKKMGVSPKSLHDMWDKKED